MPFFIYCQALTLQPVMVLLSTAYFPPIVYISCFPGQENCLIEQQETYRKQTYRNRCSILTANGQLDLSIPVSKPHGNHTKTKDVLIVQEDNWYIRHWRAIESAYNASPFFLFYRDDLKDLFLHPADKLLLHNDRILKTIFGLLGMQINYQYTEVFEKRPAGAIDLRNEISPKKKMNAELPPYPQVFSDKSGFIPNLSILDLLFNLGPESADYLKKIAETNPYLG